MSLRSAFVCTIASICTTSQISKDAQTNRDKITPDLLELSLSMIFSRHGSTLPGLWLHFYPSAWDDPIAAFHDHGILPDDTWREVQRKTLGQGLPAPRLRPPAGDPGPPLTEVERPLAPPSRPLVAALPPPTNLPAPQGM